MMAAAFLGQSDGNPATHSLAASSVSARGYLHRSQHMCCHARLPVDAGSRSVARRTGASAVRPPGRRRLDLFWIRALCRMCPPLNIRAAAEAGVVAMVAHTGSPHHFFYSRQRRHRDRRDTAGGLPPVAATASAIWWRPGMAPTRVPSRSSTRAAGTLCRAPPPGRGRAGPAHADAARAQSSQPCPRLSRATATRSFSPRTSRTLLPRGPRAK